MKLENMQDISARVFYLICIYLMGRGCIGQFSWFSLLLLCTTSDSSTGGALLRKFGFSYFFSEFQSPRARAELVF